MIRVCCNYMSHFKIVVGYLSLILFGFSGLISAQEVDSDLLLKAKKGDPKAMYQVALSLDKQDVKRNGREAVKWLESSSDLGYPPSLALLAYHYRNGFGINRDIDAARALAARAATKRDGLASWLLGQFLPGNKNFSNGQIQKSYELQYPVALLYYAKLYAVGSDEFGIKADKSKSDELVHKAAMYDLPYVEDIIMSERIKTSSNLSVFSSYLEKAVGQGNNSFLALLASLSYYGTDVVKDEQKSYDLFKKASDLGDPLGVEGLADCLRIGVAAVPDQIKAYQLYRKVADSSPRAMYLLGCYKNEGVAVTANQKEARDYFMRSADDGYIFSQAIIGISMFTGSVPCDEKDPDSAFRYLSSAIQNTEFEDLPNDVKSKVYEYAAACLRYGFGTQMDVSEADKMYAEASKLNSGVSLSRASFGLTGVITPEYCAQRITPVTAADIPEEILNYVCLDYPLPEDEKPSNRLINPESSISFTDKDLQGQLVNRYDNDHDNELSIGEVSSITSLEGIKLDKDISSFGEFSYFTGVREIPGMFFQGLSQLNSISIPESIVSIGDNAFLGCSSLSSIDIPASVTKIGDWAFAYCTNLKSITFHGKVPPKIGPDFLSNVKDVTIYVPKGSLSQYVKAPEWNNYSKRIKERSL